MPRNRLPDNVKILHGEKRPSRMNLNEVKVDPVKETPQPLEWLSEDAKDYWRDIVPTLEQYQILTDVDLQSLAIMCELYAKVKKDLTGDEINAATITQLRLYQMQFGLTPVSRTNIKGASRKQKNPFAED